ncbi:hypothetical protein CsSME_00042459 [Camellia sinensis var. sinensis]
MACLQNRLIIVPSSISLYLFSLLLFSQTHICMSSRTRTKRPTLNLNLNLNLPIADIHDILPEYGFPKGIIPNAVKSYSLSSVDGSFEIELEQPCYVQFDKDELIYYDKNIKGVLRYGSVSHVSGIQAKQLFLWVSVTGMDVDFNKDMIQVHVGPLSKNLPANQFQDIPNCINKASPHSSTTHSI